MGRTSELLADLHVDGGLAVLIEAGANRDQQH
jgi:hypothetical protein